MRSIVYVVALLCSASSLSAQGSAHDDPVAPEKPPWEWTAEERYRGLERWNLLRHQAADLNVGEAPDDRRLAPLQGAEHPELFFPSQLFQNFIHSTFTLNEDSAAAWREIYAPEVSEYLGRPEDVWQRLETAAADMIWIHRQSQEVASGLQGADAAEQGRLQERIHAIQASSCLARIAALEAAREILGGQQVDRFLYTAVASRFSMGIGSGSLNSLEHRLWLEGGCR